MQTYRCHPALKSSRLGPVIGNIPLHLQQGELDGACGPHCMLMALMILGVLKRTELGSLPKARSRSLSRLWWMAERNYFEGTTAAELRCMLAPYEKSIETRVLRKNQIARTIQVIDASGVAIVNIHNADFNHWVLAVGTGGHSAADDSTPRELLILDPGCSPIPLAIWNATLSTKCDGQGRYSYDTPDGRQRVYIDNVLTVRSVQPG